MSAGSGLDASAFPLGDRYTVVKELGRGGFGQTYLAKDRHRYDELCVVKEFIPQVENKTMIASAKELFEREASVLYQLGHKQIPEFRQLLAVESDTSGRLFIVQDYMPGVTYQSLLEARQRFGGKFTETEITQLLYQLLPVLSYIHGLGLVHRDICPDNLILRQTDGLPVLIDFGSVKEIAATVRNQLAIEGVAPATPRIGKVGYIPQEQLATGNATPASDLYGLAATLLVLAAGETPETLYDPYHGTWSRYELLSPKLRQILKRMLASNPEERFPTAEAVLSALQAEEEASETSTEASSGNLPGGEDVFVPVGSGDSVYPPVGTIEPAGAASVMSSARQAPPAGNDYSNAPAMVMTEPDMVAGAMDNNMPAGLPPSRVDSAADESEVYNPRALNANTIGKPDQKQALWGLLAMLGVVGAVLLFAFMREGLFQPRVEPVATGESLLVPQVADGDILPEESMRKQQIATRREELDISRQYFVRLVDQLFYQTYPDLNTSGLDGGRPSFSTAAKNEPFRLRWDHIALNLLTRLEGSSLSEQSLQTLGRYNDRDPSRWQSQLERVGISTQALDDLTDAKFSHLFPNQPKPDGLNQPIGQIYYGLADDSARAIEFGRVTEEISFAQEGLEQEVEGELEPGEGQIYTLSLLDRQRLSLNLTAPVESTLMSLYLPEPTDDTPFVFEDSEQITWSGAVTQSGIYEIVVVNKFSEQVQYQLTISTSPPPAEEEEELTETEEPTETGEPTGAEEPAETEEAVPADEGEVSTGEAVGEIGESTQPFIQTDESTGAVEFGSTESQ